MQLGGVILHSHTLTDAATSTLARVHSQRDGIIELTCCEEQASGEELPGAGAGAGLYCGCGASYTGELYSWPEPTGDMAEMVVVPGTAAAKRCPELPWERRGENGPLDAEYSWPEAAGDRGCAAGLAAAAEKPDTYAVGLL
jgi:hypothetical protein